VTTILFFIALNSKSSIGLYIVSPFVGMAMIPILPVSLAAGVEYYSLLSPFFLNEMTQMFISFG
jgi:hypothetical protein